MFGRIVIAVSLGLPGIGLAVLAKPLRLGDNAVLLGIGLAFVLPVLWLWARQAEVNRSGSEDVPDSSTVGQVDTQPRIGSAPKGVAALGWVAWGLRFVCLLLAGASAGVVVFRLTFPR